ncbi:MAG: pectin acetylesterase-family hydrolase [Polyangia bacterium]
MKMPRSLGLSAPLPRRLADGLDEGLDEGLDDGLDDGLADPVGRCARWLALAGLAGLAACSSSPSTSPDGGGDAGTSPAPAMPITAPAGTWTFVDIAGSVCDDGTPTGIAISPSPTAGPGGNLLIYFVGGGACWDYLTCALLNTSTHGPFGQAQFDALKGKLGGTVLDRTVANNPFADYHMVVVPYCTGDLHAGDNVATYQGNGGTRVIHHKGYANVQAFLPRVQATWPQPSKLVLTGSSAGGYGSTLNYDLFRTRFAAAKGYLIDDSGPLLVGDAVPKSLRDAWYTQWRLQSTVAGACADCQADLSESVIALQSKYPQDRLSLLSYTQDQVIRAYMGGISAAEFQTDLYQLAVTRFDTAANSRTFFVTGDSHVLLTSPTVTSQGTSLLTFLTQQVSDAATWSTVRP